MDGESRDARWHPMTEAFMVAVREGAPVNHSPREAVDFRIACAKTALWLSQRAPEAITAGLRCLLGGGVALDVSHGPSPETVARAEQTIASVGPRLASRFGIADPAAVVREWGQLAAEKVLPADRNALPLLVLAAIITGKLWRESAARQCMASGDAGPVRSMKAGSPDSTNAAPAPSGTWRDLPDLDRIDMLMMIAFTEANKPGAYVEAPETAMEA